MALLSGFFLGAEGTGTHKDNIVSHVLEGRRGQHTEESEQGILILKLER